jgi:hypothetical protein
MGLIVMSDLFCLDFVVLSMGANETDINNLKLVLDGYDEPVRIPFDVEYGAVVAKNARRTVRSRAARAVYAPQARAIRLGAKVRASATRPYGSRRTRPAPLPPGDDTTKERQHHVFRPTYPFYRR